MAAREALKTWEGNGPSAAEGLLALAAWVVLDRALTLASPLRHAPPGLFAGSEYAFLAAVRLLEIGVGLGYWRLRGRWLGDLGLAGPLAARGLALGCVWAAAAAVAVAAAELFVRGAAQVSFLRWAAGRPIRGDDLGFLLLTGGLVGPALEELLFRGLLYAGLRQQLTTAWAVGLSAALFASAHTAFQSIHPVQAAGGVLFALAYERSRSLWAPLVLHVSGNVALFLVPLIL